MREKEIFVSLGIYILFGIGMFVFHSTLLGIISLLSAIYCISTMISDIINN